MSRVAAEQVTEPGTRAGAPSAPVRSADHTTASFASRVLAEPSGCLPLRPRVSSSRTGTPVPSRPRYSVGAVAGPAATRSRSSAAVSRPSSVPESRRAGEWLARLRPVDVKGLWEAARRFAERVAPLVVAREVETRGCVPVFVDATGIEVDGALFERARGTGRAGAATGCTRCSWAVCGRRVSCVPAAGG